MDQLSFAEMTGPALRRQLGELTFVTATDGNHGRGVAWTANRLQQRSVVYMPQGSAPERLQNIRRLGADASILPMPYDDAVRHAKAQAAQKHWVLVQDTDGPGYTRIPTWIMQGYTTMAWEALAQLQGKKPTHIFLQAGVGSMAGALAAFFADVYGDGPEAPPGHHRRAGERGLYLSHSGGPGWKTAFRCRSHAYHHGRTGLR